MSLQHIQKNSPGLLPKPAKFEKNPPNGYRVIRKTKCGAGGAGGAGGARSSPIHKQASLVGRLKRLFYNIRIRIAIIRLFVRMFYSVALFWVCPIYRCKVCIMDSKTRSVKLLNKINAGFSIQFSPGTHSFNRTTCADMKYRGHGGAVVTHSPPTSKAGSSNPGLYVGKLVVAYQCSVVYS